MNPRTLVIPHGKSEVILCRRIGMLLRQPMVFHIPHGAEEAITIAQLPEILSSPPFSSEQALHRRYRELAYDSGKDRRMGSLTIFPIMDVDSDRRSLNSYRNREMFRDSPFHDRIVPIYNDPNLDAVMEQMGYGTVMSKKVRSYARIVDGITDPLELYGRLERNDSTNMDMFLKHCLSISPPYQNKVL